MEKKPFRWSLVSMVLFLLTKNNDFLQYDILKSEKEESEKKYIKKLEGHIGFLINSTIIDFYLRHFFFFL